MKSNIISALSLLPWRQVTEESIRYGVAEQIRDPYQIRHSLAIYEAWKHRDNDSFSMDDGIVLKTAAGEYVLEGSAKAIGDFCRRNSLDVYVPRSFPRKK